MARHNILFYEYVEDMAERRVPHRDAHLAHIREYLSDGRIVMAGAVGEPPHSGVLVFGDVERPVIEGFVTDDPYKAADLITAWRVEPWNTV